MEPKKRRKILYIITKSNMGGAQRYVYDLATNLPADEFEPIVAFGAPVPGKSEFPATGQGTCPLEEKLELAGVETIHIPHLERNLGAFKELLAFLAIVKIIWKSKPQIVHLNSSKAGGLGALAVFVLNCFSRIKNLFIIHNSNFIIHSIFTAHGWAFKEKRKAAVKKIIEYSSWLTIFLCHKTIVVSQDDLEKVKNFLFVQSKIKLIHNGIGKQIFLERTEARKIITEKIGRDLSDKKFWIGTVAELHKNKGLEYAITAIKTIVQEPETKNLQANASNLAYVIIGEGEQRQNLEMAIEQNNLANTAFLAGECPEASKLLRAFDLFLLPSLKEGLPYTLLEAGAAGLPTVASNVGGVAEIIEDMKSGIVIKSKRPKEISDALTFLFAHKEKMEEFGNQLKKTVEEKYTLERMVKETVAVYADR